MKFPYFFYIFVKTNNHNYETVSNQRKLVFTRFNKLGGQIGSYRQLVDENGNSIVSPDAVVIEGDVTFQKCQDTDYEIIVTGEVIGKMREEV